MENLKMEVADLFAELCLDPGFVLLPQDRYEELIGAEKERDILEASLAEDNAYTPQWVLRSIRNSRRKEYLTKILNATISECDKNAE